MAHFEDGSYDHADVDSGDLNFLAPSFGESSSRARLAHCRCLRGRGREGHIPRRVRVKASLQILLQADVYMRVILVVLAEAEARFSQQLVQTLDASPIPEVKTGCEIGRI